ncbi:MAG: hypothetical protein CMJ84_15410 [Planctomycetes bacterium]|jgi:hypothetical protein|nr:hypothetical protein [Planctomycetota bacterium]MDP6410581.1 FG-GAP repeat protein [Planctomycetota bacterium]
MRLDTTTLLAGALVALALAPAQAGARQIAHETHELLAADGATGDRLGRSVAISGGLGLAGSYFDDNQMGTRAGAAYLFDLDSGEQIHKLTATDGQEQDRFGISVALTSTLALVGAHWHYDGGAAYLIDVTSGAQIAKLLPDRLRARPDRPRELLELHVLVS